MNKSIIFFTLLILMTSSLNAQKDIRNFIFGHSLIHHEYQLITTPSQETSVPHWFASLANSAGNQYVVSGQYGFLPQHANLPPIAQWGFDSVDGAWDSDNEDFSRADFNSILITPGNFIQWQGPEEDYPSDPISPVEATIDIFEWCNEQEPNLNFYIYENWPDMAPYLSNDFPPSETEWAAYNEYLNKDFHDWFFDYYQLVSQEFENSCISFVPVGTLISTLLQRSPYDQIPITELYEDNAPHGRATIYFLASLVTYMTVYEEIAPLNYEVDPIIHPLVRDNYQDVIDFIWSELIKLNDGGEVTVFCGEPILSNTNSHTKNLDINISPNPTNNSIKITGDIRNLTFNIYNLKGEIINQSIEASSNTFQIDISQLSVGSYLLVGTDKYHTTLVKEMIIKI